MQRAEPPREWYVTHEGKQFGPVTIDDLKFEADRGKLDPHTHVVWKKGLESWIPAGEVEGVFEKDALTTPVPPAPSISSPIPASTTAAPIMNLEIEAEPKMEAKGTSRGTFLFTIYLLPILLVFGLPYVLDFFAGSLDQNMLGIATNAIFALFAVSALIVSINRLTNLGMSRKWWFGLLVPFLGYWVGYRMTACPTGYANHKIQDPLGWLLAILYWLCVTALLLLGGIIVYFAIQSPEEFQSLSTFQEVIDLLRTKLQLK